MGMYSLIEDARMKALEAANCWHETEEAKALLAKADAFERLSDRWYGECPEAAKGFTEAALDVEDALEGLRSETVIKAAESICGYSGPGETYDYAWEAADDDAPPVSQIMREARRAHAGDGYLERFVA